MSVQHHPSDPEDDSEETVYDSKYQGGTDRGRYHTDEDCSHLERSKAYFEKPRDKLSSDRTLCRICAGEHTGGTPENGDPFELTNALLRMDPDDLLGED